MSMEVMTLDREIDPPDIQAISDRIAGYKNGAYRLLMVWLAEPGLTTSQALKLADTSRVTYQRYRARLDGFKGLVDYLRDTAHSLKSVYAQRRIENAIPSLTDAMISRGLSHGKDSQRAGEKLLESVGVLAKPDTGTINLDGFDTLEIIAARLHKTRKDPA